MKTASLARVHDEAKSFNLFLVKSHLLWLPFQIKKSCMIWKIDGISFLNFLPRYKGAYEAPRGEKITHGDPTETEMSNLCAASFEGFWTRFVMDRCRANTFWDYELTRRCLDAFYITTERGIIMKMYWKWALSLLMLPWLNTPWLKLVAHTSC